MLAKQYTFKKHKIWIGFILMLLLSWIGNKLLYESNFINDYNKYLKYVKYFSSSAWTILIFLIGNWVWYDYPKSWVKKVWRLSYIINIGILSLFIIRDLVFGFIMDIYRIDITTVNIFFKTPLPFLILYLLSKKSL